VDLSEVNFIASIGMRTLISSAKAQAKRGGKIVLFNAQPMVREALETAGVNQVVPLFDDLNSAQQVLQGVV
jgi:anti-sigma B factor antagonist